MMTETDFLNKCKDPFIGFNAVDMFDSGREKQRLVKGYIDAIYYIFIEGSLVSKSTMVSEKNENGESKIYLKELELVSL